MRAVLAALALLTRAPCTLSNQLDVFFGTYAPPAECVNGCARWAGLLADGVNVSAAAAGGFWKDGRVPSEAANMCAMPGAVVNKAGGPAETASAGPFCFCKHPAPGAERAAYCLPKLGIPEQINLQYAAQDTLVAAFVTYEVAPPTEMAVAVLTEHGGSSSEQQLTGVSHWVAFDAVIPAPKGTGKPMGERNWTMHFVKLAGLKPATNYTYRVKSGSKDGIWSPSFTFRSARAAPDTRLAMCECSPPTILLLLLLLLVVVVVVVVVAVVVYIIVYYMPRS
eukprot:COSAG01_NODE_16017_length_1278_cov_1.408821_2_plen_280_part_00